MTKWLFVAKIRTIRQLGDTNQKAEAASQVEKMVSERELSLFLSRNPHIDLREEIAEMKSEIVELCQRISDISYECYVIHIYYIIFKLQTLRKEKLFLTEKLTESQSENEKLRQEYESTKQQAMQSQKEYNTVK